MTVFPLRSMCKASCATILSACLTLGCPVVMPLIVSGCASGGYGQLSESKQEDVRRIETYLNNLRSMEAGFAQNGFGGNQQGDGHFTYVPGALRMDYDIPTGRLVLAHDEKLMLIDRQTESVTRLSLRKNPLGYLLRHPISFSKDVQVTDVRYGSDYIQISLAQADNPSQGLLTLQFSDMQGKLTLVGLKGVDAQNHHFGLAFYEVRENQPVPKDIFSFPKE